MDKPNPVQPERPGGQNGQGQSLHQKGDPPAKKELDTGTQLRKNSINAQKLFPPLYLFSC